MPKRLFLIAIALAAMCPLSGAARLADAPPAPAALADFFKPGVIFQDRNNDGVIDFVDAQIRVSDHPTPAELSAAADVAARLGFETSAMNLPIIVPKPDTPIDSNGSVIFIGAKSLAGSGVSADAIGGAGMKPGDGLVAAFSVSGKPAVAVLGADDDGLNAAAVMLAGHLPYVWDQKGPTTDKIADDVKQFLAGKGVAATSAVAQGIYVHAGAGASEGADRVAVSLQMSNGGDLVKAQVALNQFKATGARDAKRALSYANVRAVQVRLRATGSGVISIELPRATAPEVAPQPLSRRPGGGAKENFDLSSFYTNEGALADSDNNLIPDRVDVLLSADGDGSEGIVNLAARLGLESTGISLPMAKPPKAITAPESEPILILVGASHPLVDQLVKNHKLEPASLQPGEGLIQVVKKAFGEKSAVVVTGGDASGVDRAVEQIAEKFPHLWQRGKDRTTLDDVEEDVRKFVAGRSPAGQAAMSLYKLDKVADELRGKDLTSARVSVFVEKAADGLAGVLKQEAAAKIKAASLTVDVQTLDVQKGRSLVSDDFVVASGSRRLLGEAAHESHSVAEGAEKASA